MVIPNLRIDSERLWSDFEALSEIGATPEGGVSRLALSPEDLTARAWFADRIEEAGLLVRDDDAGNLSGVLSSRNRKAKTLLIGSHLDSVPNGGRYDGAMPADAPRSRCGIAVQPRSHQLHRRRRDLALNVRLPRLCR